MTTASPLFDGITAARRRAQQKHQSPFPYRQNSLLFLGIVVFFATLLPYFNVSVTNFHSLEATFHELQKSSFTGKAPLTEQKPVRQGQDQARAKVNTNDVTEVDNQQKLPLYHMVFSTSCSEQQNWESYVVFYHAMRVRQRGNVTRIVSGCNDKEAASLTEFHDKYIAPMAIVDLQSFNLHHTPDFSRLHLSEGKHAYKYNNKPFGLRHWMENGLGLGWSSDHTTIVSSSSRHQDLLDSIVMLIDPDIILLRPIVHDFSENANQLWVDNIRPEKPYVTHGNPISQQDGYLANEWMKFDFKYITQSDDIKPPPWKEGPRHWNTGPPYLATTKDMYSIVTQWTSTAPRVLQIFPQLCAEMYGFITATVILNLPFWMTKSIVISTTIADDREGWKFIDELPDDQVCRVARTATGDIGDEYDKLPVLPNGLHYCKRYVLGKVSRRCSLIFR
jgi:hypothetical protein